ncbi:cation diffusion facilitator family transporter [Microbacterium enclense]|uniref:cation diffusion facilitator family transporter n=1 Tax=Microbacterium enclense TaxID=993073 RepID=UPI0021A32D51|nr:cation diffusion facilitator family transporter [Microbacterium enclense]MCT2085478.1 cation diffusion facilitator family transporter [Microbacterium enclense]
MKVEGVSFGRTQLPARQADALRRAARLEWISIGTLVITATSVFLVLGSSQAMRAAWFEDLLSFIPPIAFLVAIRVVRTRPSPRHPYGRHRSVGVGHLVAAVALTAMGGVLVVESGLSLLRAEHPTIGTVALFGHSVWLGWLMIIVMAVTGVPPVILGHMKMGLARELHDKVLYADADMNKADWMTSLGTIVGVLGIALGVWWMDATAALLIAGSIVHDGIRNLIAAVSDLMDARAMSFDDRLPHPLVDRIDRLLADLDWVRDAGSRARDEGHVFHIEAFVVPHDGTVTLAQLNAAREACVALDWKVQDIVVVPVPELPDVVT